MSEIIPSVARTSVLLDEELLERLAQKTAEVGALNWAAFCLITHLDSVFARTAETQRNDFSLFLTLLEDTFEKHKLLNLHSQYVAMVGSFAHSYIITLSWRARGRGFDGFLQVLKPNPGSKEQKDWQKKFARQATAAKKETARQRKALQDLLEKPDADCEQMSFL
ncbi:hypothetical protein KA082_00430 [Candidatus Woesebacteria bacterium]|nr:hypothetical protein [Candidatus Woesebacteria bacterium]